MLSLKKRSHRYQDWGFRRTIYSQPQLQEAPKGTGDKDKSIIKHQGPNSTPANVRLPKQSSGEQEKDEMEEEATGEEDEDDGPTKR